MSELNLSQTMHPQDEAERRYSRLVGIESQKQALFDELVMIFDQDRANKWLKRHHPAGLALAQSLQTGLPLIVLAGEVGCGKTELAHAIATPVGKELDKRIAVFETPSNIRGSGRVGELSNRITEAFSMAKARVPKPGCGILIVDEADDLATSRDQNQAHHEDRAGLNVLIKQLDLLQRERTNLAVIMITNRIGVLDPALRRRCSLELQFDRPRGPALYCVFEQLLDGAQVGKSDIEGLVRAVEKKQPAYSFSDLFLRVGRQALLRAQRADKPLDAEIIRQILGEIEPSPLMRAEGTR